VSSRKRSSRSICRKRPSSGGSCSGVPVLAASPGDLDRDRPVADTERDSRRLPEFSPKRSEIVSRGGDTPRVRGNRPQFGLDVVSGANGEQQLHGSRAASASRDIALSFLRLAKLDSEIVDRLSRYEAAFGGSSRRRCSPCKRSNTGKDSNDWSPTWVLLVTARNDLI
jgi:hypothetical protein